MGMKIIDVHSHLWLRQDTVVNGLPVKTTTNGRSIFLGTEVQMIPPFIIDGRNTAEVFLSNMDYAQVSAAVVVQEFIDGIQNDYYAEVARKYPDRFKVCAMCDFREDGWSQQAKALIESGIYSGIAIPGHRLTDLPGGAKPLNSEEMMSMFRLMEQKGLILSLCLHENNSQIGQVNEIIQECPNLKIAIGHFGMVTYPDWKEQIKLARNRNVMVESGGITWLFNSEFYPFSKAVRAIREAADLVGMDKLMWGSDYPRTITAITYRMSYDFITKSQLLTQTEKEQFLGLNAQSFYGFRNLVELPYIKNMSE